MQTEEHTYKDTTEKMIDDKIKKISAFEIANILNDQYKKRIQQSRNIDGSGMTALKAETIRRKREAGGRSPSKPLIFTGDLQQAGLLSGNETEAELTISDNAKVGYNGRSSGATNHSVLRQQKPKGRFPFGFTRLDFPAIAKYIKDIFKFD